MSTSKAKSKSNRLPGGHAGRSSKKASKGGKNKATTPAVKR